MKKLIYCLMAVTLLWTSCSKEEIDFYSGQESIYFAQQWGVAHFQDDYLDLGGSMRNCLQPSSKIPFGEMIVTDSILSLTIQTSGATKEKSNIKIFQVLVLRLHYINTAQPLIVVG